MITNELFDTFTLDQLEALGDFEAKRMFGGIVLLKYGCAFAKIKHDKLWLKVNEMNRKVFEEMGMNQYSYGKDNSRKLNFYETPIEVIEDRDKLKQWVEISIKIATENFHET